MEISDWIGIGQAVLIFIGLAITGYQLNQNAKASRVATLERIEESSRNLQLKILDDPDLHTILLGEKEGKAAAKRDIFIGTIINHYSFVYDLYGMGQIPEKIWNIYCKDMKNFFLSPVTKTRWEQVSKYHTPEFRRFIDGGLCV